MAKNHEELIAKEGWIFFFPLLILALLSFVLQVSWWVGALFAVLAAYVAYFFRNPYRQIPAEPGQIVSPADGKVVAVQSGPDGRHTISIFLNIFNVHINRSPVAGTVSQVTYHKGKFLAAYKEEASTANERNHLVIRDGDFEIEVIQIAGLIARRIVCWVGQGEKLIRGQRFGLIRFGSRVDLILPANCRIVVKPGQKIAGGSDILAVRSADEPLVGQKAQSKDGEEP